MTVAVAGFPIALTAFAIRALQSTVFPLRLCYLIIAVDIHKVLKVVTVFQWPLDSFCGHDDRR